MLLLSLRVVSSFGFRDCVSLVIVRSVDVRTRVCMCVFVVCMIEYAKACVCVREYVICVSLFVRDIVAWLQFNSHRLLRRVASCCLCLQLLAVRVARMCCFVGALCEFCRTCLRCVCVRACVCACDAVSVCIFISI